MFDLHFSHAEGPHDKNKNERKHDFSSWSKVLIDNNKLLQIRELGSEGVKEPVV